MSNSPIDRRIAEGNRALAALDRRNAALSPSPPPLPDRATLGERLAAHGSDSGVEFRVKVADDLHAVTASIDKLRRNPTLNAAQQELAVADAVKGRVDRLRAEGDDEAKRIDAAEHEVEQGIEDALSAQRPEWHQLAAEYRAAMLDMTDAQRFDFVERHKTGRVAPLLRFAIASVPPELSGVSLTQHKQTVDMLLAIKNPTLLSRPADLRKRRAALEKMMEGIERTAAELADFDNADIIRELTK
jgi:hypothetical protein